MNSLSKREIAKRYVKVSIHYGHRPREWNPKMAPYLLYTKYGYHIFDLVKTSKLLHLAGNILEQKVKRGKICLFVGTGKISAPLISKYAKQCNSFYINYRWLGGILTNWTTIQKRIAQLKELEALEIKGWLNQMSKKETRKKRKRLEKLRRLFQGIKDMPTLPDIVVFTNTLKDSLAIQECLRLGIPAVAILDSNCNPDRIPYPIPANDDSSGSINFILNYLTKRMLHANVLP